MIGGGKKCPISNSTVECQNCVIERTKPGTWREEGKKRVSDTADEKNEIEEILIDMNVS